MRVVYISTLDDGGPVSHLLNLAPRVAAAGASVRIVCATHEIAAQARARGVEAEPFPLRHKADFAKAARLWPQLRGADVIHTQDRRALLLCGAVARATGAAVVHTYHGLPEELVSLPGQRGVQPARLTTGGWLRLHVHLPIEALLTRLGTLVVPSQAMARFLSSRGFNRRRMRVIHSRIDLRRVAPAPPHQPLRVAFAGRLEHHKGVDVLIDACARAADSGSPPLRLDVYGDGSLRAALEHRARQQRVDARFHGVVTDVRERLLESDVFVLPSRGENFPISVLEAMAAALPVIASRVGGVPELVDHRVTGLIVEPDDAPSLAVALRELASDPACAVAMGAAGARRVRERFDAADAGVEMMQLYEGLCASSM